jgi:hypothetical protein
MDITKGRDEEAFFILRGQDNGYALLLPSRGPMGSADERYVQLSLD